MLSLAYLGSYNGICDANVNLVDVFKKIQKEKRPNISFNTIRKIAIEAPSKTEFTINDVDIIMPSTGIFELGLDYVQIEKLVFKNSVQVNIVYLY